MSLDNSQKSATDLIKKAVKKIQQLTEENTRLKQKIPEREPIAIIGSACRLPGDINNLEDLWELLQRKRDVISLQARADFSRSKQKRAGGFLTDPYAFAIKFFKLSPREVSALDPQQRLLLELTWEALEDAAICPSSLSGSSTGVFVGIGTDDYSQLMIKEGVVGPYFASGNSHSTAAGRISHTFDLQGPCIAIDTACSSSLVALHLACDSLKKGECSLAIVASVNLLLNDVYHENFEQAGMLAKDGLCKVFDDQADGYVRSEGCAAVILKTLSTARNDNDAIWAVIEGSALNHDGRSSGLTVPNQSSQQQLLEKALENAEVEFADLAFIEAHGSGTALGDPIEINALANVCRKHQRKTPLYLGSVKANLGHLEPAAGMVGLLKAILCLKHQSFPGQAHFNTLNRHANCDGTPIIIPKDTIHSPNHSFHLAGVSSFGFSGTNCHIILSAAKDELAVNQQHHFPQLLLLSAKTREELDLQVKQTLIYLEKNPQCSLTDMCQTLIRGRDRFAELVVFIARTHQDMCHLLRGYQQNLPKVFYVESDCQHDELVKNILAGSLDFNNYYQDNRYNKVRLPTYPFVRETIHFSSVVNNKNVSANIYYEIQQKNLTITDSIDVAAYQWLIMSPHQQNELSAFQQLSHQHLSSLIDLKNYLNHSSQQAPLGLIIYFPQIISFVENVEIAIVKELLAIIKVCQQSDSVIKCWLVCVGEKDNLVAAALRGAFSALKLEFPQLLNGYIEFTDISFLKSWLLQALFYSCQHPQLFLTENGISATVLREAKINYDEKLNLSFDNKGVYVITGGSGGIAQLLVPWLLSKNVGAIALISRNPPKNLFSHSIHHFMADVTQEKELFAVFEQIKEQLGPIKGVLHAAGNNEYQAALTLAEQDLINIMAPKITGAKLIARYFSENQIDFILHFSSIAAIWGVAKMVPYSAANTCLAAIAHQYSHNIIHFGPWQNIGMAKRAKLQNNGVFSLSADEALRALDIALQTNQPYVVANIDWQRFVPLFHQTWQTQFFNELYKHETTSTSITADLNINAELIRTILARVIGCDECDIESSLPFLDMGIDSIMALEFVRQLQGVVKQKLPSTLLFNYPTLEKLLTYFSDQTSEKHTKAKTIPNKKEGIAIIGVSCRTGDRQDANAFWQSLLSGDSLIQANINDAMCARAGENWQPGLPIAGQLLENITDFDCEAFRISPHEARLIDPQQRLLLECTWHALESAGYSVADVKDESIGVFIGVSNNDYAGLCRKYMRPEDALFYPTSQALNVIAGRIAYFFGLVGPSLVVDTACSSSLMAVHLACQSIISGESAFAIAGGVNVFFNLENMDSLVSANMLSRSGACRPFDNDAEGYVRAEGVGVVILKALSKAQQDGDRILGVIHGSFANQDGQSASLTAPSKQAQIAVMKQALTQSAMDNDAVDLVQAHGTGTQLGDAIEWQSITEALQNTEKSKPIIVSSIKGQVGHAESAAGILSLISALGSVSTGYLLAQTGLNQLNAHLNHHEKFIIPTQNVDRRSQATRVGIVNAFGFSGTNVSLVISNEHSVTVEDINHPFPRHRKQFNKQTYSIVPVLAKQNCLYQIIKRDSDQLPPHSINSVFAVNAIHSVKIETITTPDYDLALPYLNNYCVQAFLAAIKQCQTVRSDYINYQSLMSEHANKQSCPPHDQNVHMIEPELRVVKHVAEHLADILSGKKSALSVLFPEGSDELLTAVYRHSKKSQQMNHALALALQELLLRFHTKAPLKILEVGAGTGATTRSLLPVLANVDFHYTYTDISSSLLDHAKQRFHDNKRISYQSFDLNQAANLPLNFYQAFDVIVAANVIHATENINQSLALLNQCLAHNGVLLIFEGTQKIPWIDFVFGLTAGWWAFKDERNNHPLLSPPAWQKALTKNGFNVKVIAPDKVSGQTIFVAQKEKLTEQLENPCVLVFVNDREQENQWHAAARLSGLVVQTVLPEEKYSQDDQAFAELLTQGTRKFTAIYYQWIPELKNENDEWLLFTFIRLIRLKQKTDLANLPFIVVGDQGPESTALFAMTNVAAIEYPQCPLTIIEMDQIDPNLILRELFTNNNLSHIHYELGKRYVRYLAPIQPLAVKSQLQAIIGGAVWIITGGCGDLGLEVATLLARNKAEAIILIGRNRQDSKGIKYIEKLTQQFKTKIIVHQCDIASAHSIQILINELKTMPYTIKGIFHLAGVVKDRLMDDMSYAEYQTVFQAKVYGTKYLIQLAKTLAIEHFIAFSTATAVMGNVGQVNHAAANAYMDAYVCANKNDFKQALTINWGPWLETKVLSSEQLKQLQEKGIRPFSLTEGIDCLASILTLTNVSQIMAMSIDWTTFAKMRAFRFLFTNFWPSQDPAAKIEVPLSDNEIDSEADLKYKIKELFARKLQCSMDKFNDTTGFSAYGVDSLMSMTLTKELSSMCQHPFDNTILYDYPNFNSLTNFIISKKSKPTIRTALKDLIAASQSEIV